MAITAISGVSRVEIYHNKIPRLAQLRQAAYFDQWELQGKIYALRRETRKAVQAADAQRQASMMRAESPAYVLTLSSR